MKISVRFKQPEKFNEYRKMPKELERDLKALVNVTTRQTSYAAKSFAPVDKSRLKSSIHPIIKDLTGVITVDAEYGPYVEFGTGGMVIVPAELRDYAMQFKGKGIRQVNTRAQPYLYPALFINREKFNDKCKKILKKIV